MSLQTKLDALPVSIRVGTSDVYLAITKRRRKWSVKYEAATVIATSYAHASAAHLEDAVGDIQTQLEEKKEKHE